MDFIIELNNIHNMCCLDGMAMIPDGSIDMILCDLPYGTTACYWDIKIPFEPLWAQYNRIIKKNGAILLFSAQPFTTDLINSNRKMFRYEIIWVKTLPVGFLNANKMPMRAHENILVFYKKLPTYNPIMRQKEPTVIGYLPQKRGSNIQDGKGVYGRHEGQIINVKDTGVRYPTSVINFSNKIASGCMGKTTTIHSTQKPVKLCEYLIKTYSNPDDIVLDNCMGSGSTAIAAMETGRRWIGFEKDYDIWGKAVKRIEGHTMQLNLL